MALPLDGLALLQGYQANEQRAQMVPLQRQLIEMQLAEKQRAMGQDQQTQATLGRLGNAGPEQLGMALLSSNPDVGARLLALASQQKNQQQQTAVDRERIGAQERLMRQRMELAAEANRNRPKPQGPIVQTDDAVYERTPNGLVPLRDPMTGQPIKPKGKTERSLPSSLQNKLTEGADLADATERFRSTFNDDFGGKTFTGGLGNTVGRIFGDDTGQSQWWQDYELHQSQIRNKLFGSALTAPEISAWEKSAINPRMDSKQIRTNLTRREMLEARGIQRLMKGAAAGGYNKEQIEAFTGRSLSDFRSLDVPKEEAGIPTGPDGFSARRLGN